MLLDTTTRKLQVVLDGAIQSVNCSVTVSYIDYTANANPVPGTQVSTTNGVTAVDICSAPASSTQRRILYLHIYNKDSRTAIFTIRLNDNGTLYTIQQIKLVAGENFVYNIGSGFTVINTVGALGQSGSQYLRTIYLYKGATSYTPSPDCNIINIELIGAGGGGGGASRGTSAPGMAGGGGAGGYLEKYVAVTANGLYTCDVGAGGAGGAAGANNGTTGGNTSITIGGTTYTGNGGGPGIAMATGSTLLSALGGAGGTATNGDFNQSGMMGKNSFRNSTTTGYGGGGGTCKWSKGTPDTTTDQTGVSATGYGGGGQGACAIAANRAGGAGSDGLIVIEEYS